MTHEQPLDVVFALGAEQYRHGLALARHDDWPLLGGLHISGKIGSYLFFGCNVHKCDSSPATRGRLRQAAEPSPRPSKYPGNSESGKNLPDLTGFFGSGPLLSSEIFTTASCSPTALSSSTRAAPSNSSAESNVKPRTRSVTRARAPSGSTAHQISSYPSFLPCILMTASSEPRWRKALTSEPRIRGAEATADLT